MTSIGLLSEITFKGATVKMKRDKQNFKRF